jgi:hypothetical protein
MPVVNIHHRVPYDVYIGRPGKGREGPWGNPFSHRPGTAAQYRVESVEQAIACYRPWLWQQIRIGAISVKDLAALHGKTLGCFCAPRPCHGHVLEAAAAWAAAQS